MDNGCFHLSLPTLSTIFWMDYSWIWEVCFCVLSYDIFQWCNDDTTVDLSTVLRCLHWVQWLSKCLWDIVLQWNGDTFRFFCWLRAAVLYMFCIVETRVSILICMAKRDDIVHRVVKFYILPIHSISWCQWFQVDLWIADAQWGNHIPDLRMGRGKSCPCNESLHFLPLCGRVWWRWFYHQKRLHEGLAVW